MVATNLTNKNSLIITKLLLIFLTLLLFGCTSFRDPAQETQNEFASVRSGVMHIVMVWLKEPGNEAHIKKVIAATEGLETIEEIQAIHVGLSIVSDRKIVDDSFDIGITMMFDNVDAMQRYLTHPEHKQTVKTILQPLASKILVYDFLLK